MGGCHSRSPPFPAAAVLLRGSARPQPLPIFPLLYKKRALELYAAVYCRKNGGFDRNRHFFGPFFGEIPRENLSSVMGDPRRQHAPTKTNLVKGAPLFNQLPYNLARLFYPLLGLVFCGILCGGSPPRGISGRALRQPQILSLFMRLPHLNMRLRMRGAG